MSAGFGVDPTKDANGKVLTGTTSDDIRQIYGALYTPGVINGCAVTTSSSAMTYTVAAGVASVLVQNNPTQAILIPVPAGTVTSTAGPSSGTRTDIVYAQQHFPSIEGDNQVTLGVGQTLPARAVALAKYTVGQGITNTNAAVSQGNIDYSIPYGAGNKLLHSYTNTYDGVHDQNELVEGNGTIYVPTDRKLRITIVACLFSNGAAGFDNSKYCEWHYSPMIDGQKVYFWNSPGLHQANAIYTFQGYWDVTAGSHTVAYSRGRTVGPGSVATHYGNISGNFFPGTTFTIVDAGAMQ